jgi:hypothetical protein
MISPALAKLIDIREIASEHAAKLTSDLANHDKPTLEELAASVQTSLIAYLLDEVVLIRTLECCERPHFERIEHLAVQARKGVDEFVLSFGNRPKRRKRYNR